MALDHLLLEVLACPEDKGPLLYFADEDRLYNPRLHRSYAVRDDIPVMLVDEATTVDDDEHTRLMAKAEKDGLAPTLGDGQHLVVTALSDAGVLDSLGMFAATAALPEQAAAAMAGARDPLEGLPDHEYVEQVVVLGMGGSGIAGDVMVAVAGPFLPVPVVVVKSYDLPDFVGPGTLVFALSFSGDTEETVEAAGEAAAAGANVVAVTAGGELARLAREWVAPVVPVPGDIPQPRAALGAMAIPPLIVLEEIGLFPGASRWVELAVEQLARRRDALVAPSNQAERLAHSIGRTIPLVHGAQALGAAAALRWKTQVNENAKSPAFTAVYPELCHNEIAGWGQNGDVTRQIMTLVNLRHDAEHPQVVRRFDLVADVLREVVADVIEVRALGEGDLAQLLDLILVGDFVSLHLAAQEGIDPGPIPVLDELKQRLRQA